MQSSLKNVQTPSRWHTPPKSRSFPGVFSKRGCKFGRVCSFGSLQKRGGGMRIHVCVLYVSVCVRMSLHVSACVCFCSSGMSRANWGWLRLSETHCRQESARILSRRHYCPRRDHYRVRSARANPLTSYTFLNWNYFHSIDWVQCFVLHEEHAKTRKLLETIMNSRQGLSSNKNRKKIRHEFLD